MAHTHHDSAGGEGFAAASWMMAMLAVIVAVVLAVALLIWMPWDNVNSSGGTTNDTNSGEQAPADNGGGVNIEGNDVDIGDVPDAPSQ